VFVYQKLLRRESTSAKFEDNRRAIDAEVIMLYASHNEL